jgi:hypothetical protein
VLEPAELRAQVGRELERAQSHYGRGAGAAKRGPSRASAAGLDVPKRRKR